MPLRCMHARVFGGKGGGGAGGGVRGGSVLDLEVGTEPVQAALAAEA